MKRLLAAPVRFYRRFISPLKGGSCCRFIPTCSKYALDALDEWGALFGLALAIWRVLRCNPFGRGGFDYVPENRRRRRPRSYRVKKRSGEIIEPEI